MNTIWRNLLWREWHEHKWKLASLTTILVSLEIVAGEPVFAMFGGPLFAIVPLAVFIAMGTAAGERTQGTLPFARSLPAKLWQTAAAKLAAGGLTLLASISFAILLPLAWLAALGWKGQVIESGPFKGVGPFETILY
ncbi:MAG TPA: hypothetical protein VHB99_09290, partial [Pirellulales bacterium]|nr:hypothetical protein [Pirellulales bacterium]